MTATSQRVGDLATSGTVAIADTAARLRAEGAAILDLSAARAPDVAPASVIKAATDALESGNTHQTPARGTETFRNAVAAKLARDNNLEVDADTEVLATLGVKHGLLLGLMAAIDPGDRVLIEDPCFVSHGPLVQLAGGVPVSVPLDAAKHHAWPTAAKVKKAAADATAMLICNPHNPTGAVRTAEELEHMAGIARKHDLWVLSDEVYERAAWGGRSHVCIGGLDDMSDRTITLMSLTKAYAMGGWRIGFATGPAAAVDAMTKLHGHAATCAPSFAQAAAAEAIGDNTRTALIGLWAQWEARCVRLANALDKLPGLSCEEPEGGFFVWADARETGKDDTWLANWLLTEYQVAVLPGSAFGPGGKGYLRLTAVKDVSTLDAAAERMGEAFASLAK